MTRSLTVKGHGSVKAQPDMMRLHYELVQDAPSYAQSFTTLKEHYHNVLKGFRDVGFNTALVKTSSIDVYIMHETKDTQKSFRSSQSLVFEDKIDLDRMSKLLDFLQSNGDFNFSLSYFAKDTEKYNQDAIISAINDAHDKAKVMASASGIKLLEIRNITYGVDHSVQPMMRTMALDSAASISATDIVIEQDVTITWDIK